MRNLRRWTTSAAGAAILVAAAGIAGQAYADPVDLSTWTDENYAPTLSAAHTDAGLWTLSAGNTIVTQENNSTMTVFYSDFDVIGNAIEVTILAPGDLANPTDPANDDDYVGFVLGFQPGDATNPGASGADYLLIDWKSVSQSTNFNNTASCPAGGNAPEGLAVSRVSGVPAHDEFWQHNNVNAVCSDLDNGLAELQRGATLGSTGWVLGVSNTFRFEYTATSLVVFVNDVEELNIAGTFPDGRLAFYNFSQAVVEYSGIEVSPLRFINIHPTSFPSPVNVCKSGLGASTPVTIWGSDTFDVAEIDLTTLKLGSAELKTKGQTPNCSVADIGAPNSSVAAQVSCDDPTNPCDGADWVEFGGEPDGFADLTCHFYTSQIGTDEVIDDTVFSLPLTGETCDDGEFVDGLYSCVPSATPVPFEFSDEIKLNKKCLAEVEALPPPE